MPPIPRTRRRRPLTLSAGVRRRLQKISPYLSLFLLLVPLVLVEPLKLAALIVVGKGPLDDRDGNDDRGLCCQPAGRGATF
jgi:hypothetical protein